MDNFIKAFSDLLAVEGGFSDHDNDKGGATNYGISVRFLKQANIDIDGDGHVGWKDINSLTVGEAKEIYREYFWNHYQLGKISSSKIASRCLDLVVNMRGRNAVKIIQRAVNMTGCLEVKADGIIGPQTIGAINNSYEPALISCICVEAWKFYQRIVHRDPSQKVFLNGWRNRAFRAIS